MNILRTAEINMVDSVKTIGIAIYLLDASRATCSTHHTVLKTSPGAAIFGPDILLDNPLIAEWKKIGEHGQQQTDLNTAQESKGRIDYDYQVGQKCTCMNNYILRKAESRYLKEPWMIT